MKTEALMSMQVTMMLYALQITVMTAWTCLFSHPESPSQYCKSHPLAGLVDATVAVFITIMLGFFKYLLALTSYLAITNQTTYEVMKGPKYPPLEPFYKSHTGRPGYKLPEQLPHLLWDEITGNGPPKPFSVGVVGNLAQFFCEPWPRQYPRQSSGSDSERARPLSTQMV